MMDSMMPTNVEHEAAVFEKAGNFSVIALSVSPSGMMMLGRSDPRSTPPVVNSFQQCHRAGRVRFENSIKASLENGWRLVWRGFPYGRRKAEMNGGSSKDETGT